MRNLKVTNTSKYYSVYYVLCSNNILKILNILNVKFFVIIFYCWVHQNTTVLLGELVCQKTLQTSCCSSGSCFKDSFKWYVRVSFTVTGTACWIWQEDAHVDTSIFEYLSYPSYERVFRWHQLFKRQFHKMANCRRIFWVCLAILWDWRLKG